MAQQASLELRSRPDADPVFQGPVSALPAPQTLVPRLLAANRANAGFLREATRALVRAVEPETVATWLPALVSASFGGDAAQLDALEDCNPKRYCGKIFRDGEICWNCRTCEADATCVQCDACFQASDHEGHEVFFHKASPNGCCDCGDEEAWAREGCCPLHRRVENEEHRDPVAALEPDFAATARTVLEGARDALMDCLTETVLAYEMAAQPLQGRSRSNSAGTEGEANADTPVDARLSTNPHFVEANEGGVRVLIHNDDWHTYDEITALLRDCFLRPPLARMLTEQVDSDGEAEVRYHGESPHLPEARTLAYARYCLRQSYEAGVITSICTEAQLRSHRTARMLTEALTILAGKNDGLMRMIAEVLASPNSPPGVDRPALRSGRLGLEEVMEAGQPTFMAMEHIVRFRPPHLDASWAHRQRVALPSTTLVTLLLADPLLPKALRGALHALIMRLLVDTAFFRVELAVGLSRVYPFLADHYAHGVGVAADSIFNVTVQLFTTPSVVELLCRPEPNGRQSLMYTLAGSLRRAIAVAQSQEQTRGGRGREASWLEHSLFTHARYHNCGLSDLMHCFRAPGVAATLLREPEAFGEVLRTLRFFHLMDPFERQTGAHVEYENSTWVAAINGSLALGEFGVAFFRGFGDAGVPPGALPTPEDWAALLRRSVEALAHVDGAAPRLRAPPSSAVVPRYPGPMPNPMPGVVVYRHWNVLRGQNSIHIPFHRFLGLACATLGRSEVSADVLETVRKAELIPSEVALLMDFPLRNLALAALVGARLFRRNGLQFEHMMASYARPPFCRLLRDPDVRCVQLALLGIVEANVGVEYGVAQVLDTFLVRDYLLSPGAETEVLESEVLPGKAASRGFLPEMAAAALDALLVIATELPMPLEAQVSREVVHALVEQELPFSSLFKTTQVLHDVPEPLFQKVVGELCTRSEGERPVFHLKDEHWARYDPCFWHLPQNRHETATQRLEAHYSRDKRARTAPRPLVPPPPAEEVHPGFRFLRTRLLFSETALAALRGALLRAFGGDPVAMLAHPKLAMRAVQLCTLMLHEVSAPGTHDASRAKFCRFVVAPAEGNGLSTLRAFIELQAKVEDGGTVHLGVRWLLDCLYGLRASQPAFPDCHLPADALDSLGFASGGRDNDSDAKKALRLRRRKRAQAAALRKMKKRQEQFTSTLAAEEDAPAETTTEEKAKETTLDGDLDTCIMCHTRIDEPIAYLGTAQHSATFCHLQDRRRLAARDPTLLRYTVVGAGDAQVRAGPGLDSAEVRMVHAGKEVVVSETLGRRAHLVAPVSGWASLHAADQLDILRRSREARLPRRWGGRRVALGFCGHCVHFSCWDGYLATQMAHFGGHGTSDSAMTCNVERGEALCPLCKTVANALVPHIPSAAADASSQGGTEATAQEAVTPEAKNASVTAVDAGPTVDALEITRSAPVATSNARNALLRTRVRQLGGTLLERAREFSRWPRYARPEHRRYLADEMRNTVTESVQILHAAVSALSHSIGVAQALHRDPNPSVSRASDVWGLDGVVQPDRRKESRGPGVGSPAELAFLRHYVAAVRHIVPDLTASMDAPRLLQRIYRLDEDLLSDAAGAATEVAAELRRGLARLMARQSLAIAEDSEVRALLQQAVMQRAALDAGVDKALVHPLFHQPLLKYDLALFAALTSFFLPDLATHPRAYRGLRLLLVARVGQVMLETFATAPVQIDVAEVPLSGSSATLCASMGALCQTFMVAYLGDLEKAQTHAASCLPDGDRYLCGRVVQALICLGDHLVLNALVFGHPAVPQRMLTDPIDWIREVFAWLELPPLEVWGTKAGAEVGHALEQMAVQLRASEGGTIFDAQADEDDSAEMCTVANATMQRMADGEEGSFGLGMQEGWWNLRSDGASRTEDAQVAMNAVGRESSDSGSDVEMLEALDGPDYGAADDNLDAEPASLSVQARASPRGEPMDMEDASAPRSQDKDPLEAALSAALLTVRGEVSVFPGAAVLDLQPLAGLSGELLGAEGDISHAQYDPKPFPALLHHADALLERHPRLAAGSLIPLPRLFTTLHKAVMKRLAAWPSIMHGSPDGDPCLCLLCGFITRRKRAGMTELHSLHQHTKVCGRGVGVYFMVNQCNTLLVRDRLTVRGSSVYVDANGEEDINLRRGRPLFLSEERYARLNRLWLSHAVAQEAVKLALLSRS